MGFGPVHYGKRIAKNNATRYELPPDSAPLR